MTSAADQLRKLSNFKSDKTIELVPIPFGELPEGTTFYMTKTRSPYDKRRVVKVGNKLRAKDGSGMVTHYYSENTVVYIEKHLTEPAEKKESENVIENLPPRI